MKRLHLALLISTSFGVVSAAYALDDAARDTMMKNQKCFKCHAVDKDKDGPAYKKVAEKYKGKADGESKLITHLTTGPTVKSLSDGSEDEHVKWKGSEDDMKSVIAWILSR